MDMCEAPKQSIYGDLRYILYWNVNIVMFSPILNFAKVEIFLSSQIAVFPSFRMVCSSCTLDLSSPDVDGRGRTRFPRGKSIASGRAWAMSTGRPESFRSNGFFSPLTIMKSSIGYLPRPVDKVKCDRVALASTVPFVFTIISLNSLQLSIYDESLVIWSPTLQFHQRILFLQLGA